MTQKEKYSYGSAINIAGLSVVLLLFSVILPDPFSLLANLACVIGGSIFFVWVLVNRKKLPAIWILGPASVLVFLGGLEASLHFGLSANRFLPKGIGRDYKLHPYLFWIPKQLLNGQGDPSAREPVKSLDQYGEEIATLVTVDPTLLNFRSGYVPVQKPPGRYRILTMGGSNAWGHGIDSYEDTLSSRLEKLIQKKYPNLDFEIIAAGVPGYCLLQNLVLYQLVLHKFSPDLVILYANVNDRIDQKAPYTLTEYFRIQTGMDVSDLRKKNTDLQVRQGLVAQAQQIFSNLHSYNMMVQSISKVRDKAIDHESSRMFKEMNPISDYKKNLDLMIHAVKGDGAKMILADALFYTKPRCEGNEESERLGAAMKQIAQTNNVPFVPVHQTICAKEDAEELIFQNDSHLNQKGHRFVADMLFDTIVKQGILKPQTGK